MHDRLAAPQGFQSCFRRLIDFRLIFLPCPLFARWDVGQELGGRALLKVYQVAASKAGRSSSCSRGSNKGGRGSSSGPGGPASAAAAAASAPAAKAVAPLAAVLRPLLAPPVAAVEGAEFAGWALGLPGDGMVYEREKRVDPGLLQLARQELERQLALTLRGELLAAVAALYSALDVDDAADPAPAGSSGSGGGAGQQAARGAEAVGGSAATSGKHGNGRQQQQQEQQQRQRGGQGQRDGESGGSYQYTAVGAARRGLRQACHYLLAALGDEQASNVDMRLHSCCWCCRWSPLWACVHACDTGIEQSACLPTIARSPATPGRSSSLVLPALARGQDYHRQTTPLHALPPFPRPLFHPHRILQMEADLLARLAAATSLSDAWAAAQALERAGGPARAGGLAAFHDRWGGTPAGLHKWIALMAGSEAEGNLWQVAGLLEHPGFRWSSPAACEAVFHAFAGGCGARG